MTHHVPDAPRRLKIRAGSYETTGASGTRYTATRHPRHRDWDLRDEAGVLCAREATLEDALDEAAHDVDD